VCDACDKLVQSCRGEGRRRRRLGAQGIRERLAVELEPRLREPIVLDGLQPVARRAARCSLIHNLYERTRARVRTANDERVVARVDVARDERRSLRIGARDDEALDAHDVELKSDRDEPIDVLLDGDEHLARHVTALFRARCLVLDVDSRGTLFDEKLCEFHGCRDTAMASVRVCYDGAEIVDCRGRGKLGIAHTRTLFALLAVVEELSGEEVLNLARYSVVGVISEDYSGYS